MCASLPSTRAFFSKLLPRVFSNGSAASRSKITRPSRTGRSQLTGTEMGHSHIQSSVIADLNERDYDLKKLRLSLPSFHGSGESDDTNQMDYEKSNLAGIKITTTLVTQELSLGHPCDNDLETGSTRKLVRKESL